VPNKLYLLDANVIIHAHDYYYNMVRVPEFWGWVLHHAENGGLKMPFETMDEVKGGAEAMHAQWLKSSVVKNRLLLDEEVDSDLVADIVDNGYAPDLSEVEVEKLGADPFLISYALADKANRVVISNERSRPKATRANRMIPDVCKNFDVQCYDVYRLLKDLNFSTDWRSRV
tara:strand:+ start:4645 stop:5160 length:516 start_codon:yes stop_codon:yes gene_type:complete